MGSTVLSRSTIRQGGPVDTAGGLVRSLFAERNFDNKAEIGWLWLEGTDNQPTRFWFLRDRTQPHQGRSGPTGNLGELHQYRLNNDSGNHWVFRADGQPIKDFTFGDLNSNIFNYANVEVDNSCDSAKAHYANLMDKDCDGCTWKDWSQTQNYPTQFENPCYHVELNSNTEFRVVHGSGAGEVCVGPGPR